ncbi:hypothetical protein TNCV_1175761 [Trichonephila clavipes]|nr:hypothetical protein TNCV_1175761 [Trichonephila clavipes]
MAWRVIGRLSRTLLKSPEVLLQGCEIDSMLDVDQGQVGHAPPSTDFTVNSPSKQNREFTQLKTVALGNRTKDVQNST